MFETNDLYYFDMKPEEIYTEMFRWLEVEKGDKYFI